MCHKSTSINKCATVDVFFIRSNYILIEYIMIDKRKQCCVAQVSLTLCFIHYWIFWHWSHYFFYTWKFTFVILGNFKGGNGKIWNFCQYPPVSGFMFDVVGSWCILCVWLSLCNVSCAKLWSLVWGSQYCWSCSPAHLSHSLVVNSWCCRHLIELCNILITLHCSSFAWLST